MALARSVVAEPKEAKQAINCDVRYIVYTGRADEHRLTVPDE